MAISFDAKTNFATSVVATAPVSATAGTSLVVAAGHGTLFPAAPFNVVIWPTGVQPTSANSEIVRVTAKATDTFTITRAQESTVARTVIVGDNIALNTTKKSFTDIEAAFITASALTAPIGGGMLWFTDTAPTGWLLLRGQAVSRATYAALFALWSTTFGVGDGSTTFNLPDLQSRIPIGKGLAGVLSVLGNQLGNWDHTHAAGSLVIPSHTHGPGTLTVASHNHDSGTLQVASHTHGSGTLEVASHTHGAGSLSVGSNDVPHTHSLSGHTHSYFNSTDGPSDTVDFEGGFGSSAGSDNHTHTYGGATEGPSNDNTGDASDTNHDHGISGETNDEAPAVTGNTGSTAPSVNSGNTGSRAPAVDGGATGATPSATAITGTSAAGNPPVLVINFMVRATNEV